MPRGIGCGVPAIYPGLDCFFGNARGQVVAGRCNYMLEDIAALPTGGYLKDGPCGAFHIAFDQPFKRIWLCFSGSDGLFSPQNTIVFVLKGLGAIFGPQAGSWSFIGAHIPNDSAVSSDLPMQVRRARARHGVHYRTISPAGSRGSASVNGAPGDTLTMIVPSGRTST